MTYPRGFEAAMLPYENELFLRKRNEVENRPLARMDSDLWITRVRHQFRQRRLKTPTVESERARQPFGYIIFTDPAGLLKRGARYRGLIS